VNRRSFLRSTAVGAGALTTGSQVAAPQQPTAATRGAAAPNAAVRQAESGNVANVEVLTSDKSPGSDFMVDILKSLGFEYVCANPGSSFRGLHESIINYGGNRAPELITCCHEESAVAMSHGYAKVEGASRLQ
jgi:hypothetical protein